MDFLRRRFEDYAECHQSDLGLAYVLPLLLLLLCVAVVAVVVDVVWPLRVLRRFWVSRKVLLLVVVGCDD